MALLCGRAGRSTAKNGGLRPGQCVAAGRARRGSAAGACGTSRVCAWGRAAGAGGAGAATAGGAAAGRAGGCAAAALRAAGGGGGGRAGRRGARHRLRRELCQLPGPTRGGEAPSTFSAVNRFRMGRLYGRAGRLTAKNGGLRPGQPGRRGASGCRSTPRAPATSGGGRRSRRRSGALHLEFRTGVAQSSQVGAAVWLELSTRALTLAQSLGHPFGFYLLLVRPGVARPPSCGRSRCCPRARRRRATPRRRGGWRRWRGRG
jgi:hypothetical protein